MDNTLALVALVGAILALLFAVIKAKGVLAFDEGNDKMKKLSASIREGAMAYLKRQYKVLVVFFVVMFVILGIMAAFGMLAWFVPVAFVVGVFFSGLSGYV